MSTISTRPTHGGSPIGYSSGRGGFEYSYIYTKLVPKSLRRVQVGPSPQTETRELHLVRSLPGRMRVHLQGWSEQEQCGMMTHLRRTPGVKDARASSLTGNILIHFDPAVTDAESLLLVLHTLQADVTPRFEAGQPLPSIEYLFSEAQLERHESTPGALVLSHTPRPALWLRLRAVAAGVIGLALSRASLAAVIRHLVARSDGRISTSGGGSMLQLVGAGIVTTVSVISILEISPLFRAGLSALVGPGVAELLFLAAAISGLIIARYSRSSAARPESRTSLLGALLAT